MVHIPVRAECPDRDTVQIYTVHPLGRPGREAILKKIQSREYELTFAEGGESLCIRLI